MYLVIRSIAKDLLLIKIVILSFAPFDPRRQLRYSLLSRFKLLRVGVKYCEKIFALLLEKYSKFVSSNALNHSKIFSQTSIATVNSLSCKQPDES